MDTALAIEPENTYIFGEIIHNREVVDTITERGIVTVETLSAVPDGATLIIRSHGAAKSVLTNAQRGASKRWTAPANLCGGRRRSSANNHEAGNAVVIVGERTHPEVIGLNGWCGDSAYIFGSEEDEFLRFAR